MLRLLLIIPTLDRSGAEKQFCLLAEGLSKQGIEVEVVALTRGGPVEAHLTAANVPYSILGKRNRFDLTALRKLRKLIIEREPDVLLSCLFAGNSYARLATIGMGSRRPKILISERCVDSWKSSWQHWLDRRLRSRTDLLIANSQSVSDFYSTGGFPKDRIRVIPNGVISPSQPELTKAEFCEEIGIPAESKLIAFVGRLAPQKRLKDLLWAMQMLRHSRPDAYFLLIGEGPQRSELEYFAQDADAASHSRFLGHRDDAASLLHLIDVFWLASEFEGMSNSLMEAMACGKPVVVSDISPNRELVEHGKEGWIANLGDPAGFTQYTLKLLEDPETAQKIGAAGQQKMESEFSIKQMIDRFHSLIAEVCPESSAGNAR
ncbi:glycosyltransferase [Thalassoglobus sp.]|uniref:glycosyltransferase n=1 Tax=Thalassoglobus sp. TaxID=2795869 RepID=UPI003AA85ED3